MLSPKIDYTGPWERVRQCLIDDMEHLKAAINQQWATTFGGSNTAIVSGGGTGVSSLTAHGVLVGEGTSPIVSVTGAGVVHATVGADPTISPVVEADLTLSDNTTDDVSSTKHGFTPKSPADATHFLNGAATPVFAAVKDSDLALTDIVTNNVSTTKHGFVPKLPHDATKFLDGTGAFSIPTSVAVFLARVQLTGNQLAALQTTPLTLVAGIASKLLVPITFRIVAFKTAGAGWTNGNTGFYLAYESNKATNLMSPVGLALANAGTIQSFAYQPMAITNTVGLTLSGKGLQLVTQADITSGTGGTTTINIEILYSVQDPALF